LCKVNATNQRGQASTACPLIASSTLSSVLNSNVENFPSQEIPTGSTTHHAADRAYQPTLSVLDSFAVDPPPELQLYQLQTQLSDTKPAVHAIHERRDANYNRLLRDWNIRKMMIFSQKHTDYDL